jgi:hypothetical protein
MDETCLTYGENEKNDFCQSISAQYQVLEEDSGDMELEILWVDHFASQSGIRFVCHSRALLDK